MSGLRGQSAFWVQPGGSQESDRCRLRFAPKPFMMEPSEHQVNARVYSLILFGALERTADGCRSRVFFFSSLLSSSFLHDGRAIRCQPAVGKVNKTLRGRQTRGVLPFYPPLGVWRHSRCGHVQLSPHCPAEAVRDCRLSLGIRLRGKTQLGFLVAAAAVVAAEG